MRDAETLKAIDHAIQVLMQSQDLLSFNDTPRDLEGPGRQAVLGKHVREIEDTLRELRRLQSQ